MKSSVRLRGAASVVGCAAFTCSSSSTPGVVSATSDVLGRVRASRRRPVATQPTVGGRASRRAHRTNARRTSYLSSTNTRLLPPFIARTDAARRKLPKKGHQHRFSRARGTIVSRFLDCATTANTSLDKETLGHLTRAGAEENAQQLLSVTRRTLMVCIENTRAIRITVQRATRPLWAPKRALGSPWGGGWRGWRGHRDERIEDLTPGHRIRKLEISQF